MFIACMGSLRCIHIYMLAAFLHMHLRWPYSYIYMQSHQPPSSSNVQAASGYTYIYLFLEQLITCQMSFPAPVRLYIIIF